MFTRSLAAKRSVHSGCARTWARPVRCAGAAILALFGLCGGASAAVLLVPGQFATIQQAINVAADGDKVIVSDGVYPEAIRTRGKSIKISSENGAASTTIDASLTGVVTAVFIEPVVGGGAGAILEGFTITGGLGASVGAGGIRASGAAVVRDCTIRGNSGAEGGGVRISAPNVVIEDCTIEENSAQKGGGLWTNWPSMIVRTRIADNDATVEGGGVWMQGATLDECVVTENGAPTGAGLVVEGGALLATEVSRNIAPQNGAGILLRPFASAGATTVDRCIITGNLAGVQRWGGGVAIFDQNAAPGVALKFSRCEISGNLARDGAGVYAGLQGGTHLSFDNCLISNNNGSQASGIMAFGPASATLSVVNCTFAGNQTFSWRGGAMSVPSGFQAVTVRNNVFWGNTGTSLTDMTAPSVEVVSAGLVTLRHNCAERLSSIDPETGNMSVDPLYVDAVGADGSARTGDEDYRLGASSPCIDAGDTAGAAAAMSHQTDLSGLERAWNDSATPDTGVTLWGFAIDIGAYERQPATSAACAADLNGDGSVNSADLASVLGAWGSCGQ